jgi:hypothetical protein
MRQKEKKAIAPSRASTTSIASAREVQLVTRSAAANSRRGSELGAVVQQRAALESALSPHQLQPSWGVGDTVVVPLFGRGTIVASSRSTAEGGVDGYDVTLYLADWTLAGGQRVVVHSNTVALGLGTLRSAGAEIAVVAPFVGGGVHQVNDDALEVGMRGGSTAGSRALATEVAHRGASCRSARDAAVASGSELSELAAIISSSVAAASAAGPKAAPAPDEAPPPPVLRWSRTLGRDIALLNGDTVATRTEPGDYSSAGCG